MNSFKLSAADRGLLKNNDFSGFAVFNNGQSGTLRPGNFGPLYVFNDDTLFPGSSLGMHPHGNVEIVTIMLAGEESHSDTLGIHEKYYKGDVQLISAGTGLEHSGGNTSDTEDARHLQIWIAPRQANTASSVQTLSCAAQQGSQRLIVSPDGLEGSLRINQDVRISLLELATGENYAISSHLKASGFLIYSTQGTVEVSSEVISKGDALFLTEVGDIQLSSLDGPASLVIIEAVL